MKLLSERLAYIYAQRPDLEGERGQIGLKKVSGATKSVVNQWLSNGIKSMDIRYALKIERELGFSHVWLMIGEGDPMGLASGGLADAPSLTKEELRVLAIFRQASRSNPTAKAVIDDALTLAQGLLDEALFQQKQG